MFTRLASSAGNVVKALVEVKRERERGQERKRRRERWMGERERVRELSIVGGYLTFPQIHTSITGCELIRGLTILFLPQIHTRSKQRTYNTHSK